MEESIIEVATANETTETKRSKKPIKKLILIGVIIVIIFVAGMIAFYFYNTSQKGENSFSNASPTTSISSPSPTTQSGQSTSTREDWETYEKTAENWSIDYPTDENFEIQVREGNNLGPNGIGEAVAFVKLGETQSQGTEVYDGIIFNVGVQEKDAKQSVKEIADERTEPDENIGSTRTPLVSITVNELQGWETITSGLGEFRTVFLEYPGDDEKVYYISILSTGPGEKENEYDKISEEMLNTFESLSN